MADLTPGPELDRRVAEAVGWEICGHDDSLWSFVRISQFEGRPLKPSMKVEDALAALEATGQEFIILITSIFGNPDHRAYIVRIEDIYMDEPFVSPRMSTLPLAICAAILAWKEGQR
jgi:hypothetical protein